jgi:ATP-dependent Clp protease ATP-binding subunit ClpA
VVAGAQELAAEGRVAEARAAEVRPAHLLGALVRAEDTLAVRVLAGLGAPAAELQRVVAGLSAQYADGLDAEDAEALALLGIDLDEVIGRIDRDLGGVPGRPAYGRGRQRFGSDAKKVLELSLREAVRLRDGFIGSEHLLLGLVRQDDAVTRGTLEAFGLTGDDVRRAVGEADRRAG